VLATVKLTTIMLLFYTDHAEAVESVSEASDLSLNRDGDSDEPSTDGQNRDHDHADPAVDLQSRRGRVSLERSVNAATPPLPGSVMDSDSQSAARVGSQVRSAGDRADNGRSNVEVGDDLEADDPYVSSDSSAETDVNLDNMSLHESIGLSVSPSAERQPRRHAAADDSMHTVDSAAAVPNGSIITSDVQSAPSTPVMSAIQNASRVERAMSPVRALIPLSPEAQPRAIWSPIHFDSDSFSARPVLAAQAHGLASSSNRRGRSPAAPGADIDVDLEVEHERPHRDGSIAIASSAAAASSSSVARHARVEASASMQPSSVDTHHRNSHRTSECSELSEVTSSPSHVGSLRRTRTASEADRHAPDREFNIELLADDGDLSDQRSITADDALPTRAD